MALKLDMKKLDQLSEDLAKLEVPKVIKGGQGEEGAVPMFQSKGYLEKLGKKNKWYKRFFVLRDSFLLSYNLQKSDFTVEPNKCIHLVKCKFERIQAGDKPFTFQVTTAEKDVFIFAAASEKELNSWRKDIEIARIVSHKNMVKLAVENECLAEAKGVTEITKNFSTSALSLFSNPDYIKRTPVSGGAEGWLKSPGLCLTLASKGKKNAKQCYFMLKDSHLLMFHGGDVLKKPRGAMYLVGTVTHELPEDEEGFFPFTTRSNHCADFAELAASSAAQRARWISALKVGARVTYGDFKMLLKEHEILTNYTPGQDDSPPEEVEEDDQPIARLELEDTEIQGQELEPGTKQAYDKEGNPLIRNPAGKLVDAEGKQVTSQTVRFDAEGQQLDSFNRVLPSGAVPMFTEDGTPIGVGPDGAHYLPDGTEVSLTAPHFDASGNALDEGTVKAADAVAQKVNVAIRVRQRMKGDGAGVEAVDALGRTFRPSKDAKAGVIINADGAEVPVATARRVVNAQGDLVHHEEVEREKLTGDLVIKHDDEGEVKDIGTVAIDENTSLADVRDMIAKELETSFKEFVFLVNYAPLLRYEEQDRLAMSVLPEVLVRGETLQQYSGNKFSTKVAEMIEQSEKGRKETAEFEDIMARVRQGNFLRKANHD